MRRAKSDDLFPFRLWTKAGVATPGPLIARCETRPGPHRCPPAASQNQRNRLGGRVVCPKKLSSGSFFSTIRPEMLAGGSRV